MANDVGGVAGSRLLSFIQRWERLIEEKNALAEDIKELKAEAKGVGFDVKTMDKAIKRRAMDAEKRQEEDALLELYECAISGFDHTPLGASVKEALPVITPDICAAPKEVSTQPTVN